MWYGARRNIVDFSKCGISVRCLAGKGDITSRILDIVSAMPRDRPHIAVAQKQRANIAEKSENFSPGTVYLQTLGSGCPNSLYLFTDHKRYLFNCGEGTQRLSHEHKVRLSRLEHILVTSKTWRHIGGLPGVSLTLQDVGVPKITLHGPPGLDVLYQATRRFVIMNNMEITSAECSSGKHFEDSVLTIKYVTIGPEDSVKKLSSADGLNTFNEFDDDDTDYYGHEPRGQHANSTSNRSPERKQEVINNNKDNLLTALSDKTDCSVSYICKIKKRHGTLDFGKCVEKGVKPGPLLGDLKAGRDVTLEDGTLVRAADVKQPDEMGPTFIVLDVPDIAHLKESDFGQHFDDGTNAPDDVPVVIAHFTPPHVFDNSRYREFLQRFGANTQHLVLNSHDCWGSVAVLRAQHKLHMMDELVFPLLTDSSTPLVWSEPAGDTLGDQIARKQYAEILDHKSSVAIDEVTSGENGRQEEYANRLEIHQTTALTTFHLRPKRTLDRSSEVKWNPREYISETMDVEGFAESLEQFRRLVSSRRAAPPRPYPRLVFLGTGSCIPNKTRNTSAILLHVDERRCVLLDCGEGTYGQLVRFYGERGVCQVLASLRAIYVSHLHADHHIGLIGVLQGRRRALDELRHTSGSAQPEPSLHLLAPGQIMTWLNIYDRHFESIRTQFQIIPNQTLLPNPPPYSGETMTAAVLAGLGLRSVRTCQVQHCPNAFGVTLETGGGERITYSGDTMPCDALVELGMNSDLLIHEATMEDELVKEARIKKHSTISQAIEVGRRMRARHTLLTHFSQRYARLPRLAADFTQHHATVGIAFDNMQVSLDDVDLLPHMYAPLQLMFAEHVEELEARAARRAHKRELRGSTSPERPNKRNLSASRLDSADR